MITADTGAGGRYAAWVYLLAFASAALLLGTAYGFATDYVRWAPLEFLLAGSCGVLIGQCVKYGIKLSNARDMTALFYVLLVGLLAEYANWISYIFAYTNFETLAVLPQDLWHAVQIVNRLGTWHIWHNQRPATGSILWFAWAMEAVIIVGVFR